MRPVALSSALAILAIAFIATVSLCYVIVKFLLSKNYNENLMDNLCYQKCKYFKTQSLLRNLIKIQHSKFNELLEMHMPFPIFSNILPKKK